MPIHQWSVTIQEVSNIFTMMKNDFAEQIKAFNDKRASITYSAIMKWEFDGSDEVLKVAENFVKNNPSGRSWFVFNAIADCFDSKSVTEYIYKMKGGPQNVRESGPWDPGFFPI